MPKVTRTKLRVDIVERISGSVSFNHSPATLKKDSIYRGVPGYSLVVEKNEKEDNKRVLVLNVFAENAFTNRLAQITITYEKSKNVLVDITID